MNQGARAHWSGRLGFVLAAVGSAVGLGNIWKFPYITGVHGGGAFVLVYLICIAAVGVPIFIAELYLGQKSQKDAVSAFTSLDKSGSPWQIAGWLGIVSAFLILSFYSVVGGWVLDYEFKSLMGAFSGKTDAEIKGMLGALFGDPVRIIVWHAVFMALTIGIVMGGIQKGIERWAKILMPTLVGLLLALLVWCMFLEGFGKAIGFLFTPDFSKLSADAVLVAVGHAFFTLSLGMGAMITYGSYLNKGEDLIKIGITVSILDTLIALVAGIVIFSVVFSFGQEPSAGPGLMFATLPTLFTKMPGGYFISLAFFMLVAFAALSSAISLLEVVVTYWVDEKGANRKKTTMVTGTIIFVLGLLSALSFNLLADFKIGKFTFFDLFDGLTTNLFLPFGGMVIALFFGWVLGPKAAQEVTQNKGGALAWQGLMWSARILAPVSVAWVLYTGLGKWLFGG